MVIGCYLKYTVILPYFVGVNSNTQSIVSFGDIWKNLGVRCICKSLNLSIRLCHLQLNVYWHMLKTLIAYFKELLSIRALFPSIRIKHGSIIIEPSSISSQSSTSPIKMSTNQKLILRNLDAETRNSYVIITPVSSQLELSTTEKLWPSSNDISGMSVT